MHTQIQSVTYNRKIGVLPQVLKILVNKLETNLVWQIHLIHIWRLIFPPKPPKYVLSESTKLNLSLEYTFLIET